MKALPPPFRTLLGLASPLVALALGCDAPATPEADADDDTAVPETSSEDQWDTDSGDGLGSSSSGTPEEPSNDGSDALTTTRSTEFGTISAAARTLFDNNPIVDGLMEPARSFADISSFSSYDYSSIVSDTSVNVISGKLAKASCEDGESRPCANDGFDNHVERYNLAATNPNLNLVEDAGDLSCHDIEDGIPELIPYVQKAWRIDFSGDATSEANAGVELWHDVGLRIVQLAYNSTANTDFYENNEHYGSGPGSSSGLTSYGTLVAEAAMRTGIILDVSHMSDSSVEEITDLAIARAQDIGRPVPVLANHRNVREECTTCSFPSRNMTLDMACQVAATGGVIGVTPIGTTMMNTSPADTFEDLIDHIDALQRHTCSIPAWDGSQINMIDHIAVATDAGKNGTSATRPDGTANQFYLDDDSSEQERWLLLATEMLTPARGYSQDEVRKIFGGNLLRAYRLGLEGSLPFGDAACGFPDGSFHLTDVDGDGITDALFHGDNGRTWIDHAAYSGGALEGEDWDRATAPGAVDRDWCATGGSYQLLHGDVDGDGRSDLICHHNDGRTWIDRASSSGTFHGTNWSRTSDASADNAWCAQSANQVLLVGDANGDGRDDLICQNSSGGTWVDYADSSGRFRGTNWSRTSDASADNAWCSISSSRKLFLGDTNGDGRDDLVCHDSSGRTWVDLADSSGRYRGTNWSRTSDASADNSWCSIGTNFTLYLDDVDGNGRDDMICHSRSSGRTWLDFSDSSGRFRGTNRSNRTPFCRSAEGGEVHTGDRNGDGRADLACFTPSNGSLFERFGSSSGFSERID